MFQIFFKLRIIRIVDAMPRFALRNVFSILSNVDDFLYSVITLFDNVSTVSSTYEKRFRNPFGFAGVISIDEEDRITLVFDSKLIKYIYFIKKRSSYNIPFQF